MSCKNRLHNFGSSLQAMWEDAKTGSRWVVVKRCYFPSDLPEAVAHPCAPESSEVVCFLMHVILTVLLLFFYLLSSIRRLS